MDPAIVQIVLSALNAFLVAQKAFNFLSDDRDGLQCIRLESLVSRARAQMA
jgi:hypothetical protein